MADSAEHAEHVSAPVRLVWRRAATMEHTGPLRFRIAYTRAGRRYVRTVPGDPHATGDPVRAALLTAWPEADAPEERPGGTHGGRRWALRMPSTALDPDQRAPAPETPPSPPPTLTEHTVRATLAGTHPLRIRLAWREGRYRRQTTAPPPAYGAADVLAVLAVDGRTPEAVAALLTFPDAHVLDQRDGGGGGVALLTLGTNGPTLRTDSPVS